MAMPIEASVESHDETIRDKEEVVAVRRGRRRVRRVLLPLRGSINFDAPYF